MPQLDAAAAPPPPTPDPDSTVPAPVSDALEAAAVEEGGEMDLEERRAAKGGAAVDRGPEAGCSVEIELGRGDADAERVVCRICHLSPEREERREGTIHLGCGCKDELGTAHRHCAEAWFRVKGNRCCEICGLNAKNITGIEDRRFLAEWHEGRVVTLSRNSSSGRGEGCWRRQPLYNFLMACLVIAFLLPWFFRVDMF